MAKTHFKKLNAEAQALHDSWDQILRVSALVAIVAACVWAVCFALRWAVHHSSDALLHYAEHGIGWHGPAALLAALVVSGLLRGWLIRREGWDSAAGDGMDVALANYHVTYDHAGDDPQPRYRRPDFGLAARKCASTFLTLGAAASGGLEAPSVLIGESLAAGLARLARVKSEVELRTYQIAAIAAAVSTLLGAPFAAALFAAEVAYGDRIIYRKLAYALWAGLIAYALNNRVQGFHPLFAAPVHLPVYTLGEYAMSALVALAVSVPLAVGFGWAVTHTRSLVRRVRPGLHAAGTSLLMGLIALGLWWLTGLRPTHVLGSGEETLAVILSGRDELASWWLLGLALLGKMATTGLTQAGGGSAGLLVPSMYLGGVSGALMAQGLDLLLGLTLDPALFAVVGIVSALVAVVGVPLAAVALALEVFGPSFAPPVILACSFTYVLTLRSHIYQNQRLSPDPLEDETGGLPTPRD
jgi:CIC family chloride channel protein